MLPNRSLTPAKFSYSPSFASVLAGLRSSLLATTYQAGQLVSFGTHGDELQVGKFRMVFFELTAS